MCFGGGGGQTVYLPPKEPEKVPPRTEAAKNIGQFQEQPVNAYGEPLGTTSGEAGAKVSQAQSTYLPYASAASKRF